jgi:exo-beta-1,3-glucanase (GH17 family)
VEKRLLETDEDVRDEDLEELRRQLNERLVGQRLDRAELLLSAAEDRVPPERRAVFQHLADAIGQVVGDQASERVWVGGQAHIAGPGAFDGIGAHPYPRHAPFVANTWAALDALRAVRAANDDTATPLWITEIGVSTHASTGISVEDQADVLIELYHSIEGHDIHSFVIHRFQVGSEGGYWNGTALVKNHFVNKPAFCELGAAIGNPCEQGFTAPQD